MKNLKSRTMTGFAGGGQTEFEPYLVTSPVEPLVTKLRKRTTILESFFIGNALAMAANPHGAPFRHSENPENQAGKLRRFSDYSESHNRETSTMRLRLGGRNDGGNREKGSILPPQRGREGVGSCHFPNRISNLAELGKKFCLPQLEKAKVLPRPAADLRTDVAKRIRIASRLSRLEQSSTGETLGAWSKSKTGEGRGEGAIVSPLPLGEGGTECRVRVKKVAFTLAEVLITFGIIGVVAAMTLPALTAKYQQKVLQSQFKKSYTNMQNAINLVNSENGIPYNCYVLTYGGNYHTSECKEFWTSFFSKYKSFQICENNQTSCRPRYKTKAEVVAEGGTVFNNYCSFPINGHRAYKLNDGSIIYLYEHGDGSYVMHDILFFGIDVNGIKSPNKWGYDLFYLSLYRKNEKSPTVGITSTCELIEKGGESAEKILIK